MTYQDTDTVPETDPQAQYGFLARVIGLPLLEKRLLDAIEQSQADQQALAAALTELRSADTKVDAIEPSQSKKKGTKP